MLEQSAVKCGAPGRTPNAHQNGAERGSHMINSHNRFRWTGGGEPQIPGVGQRAAEADSDDA